MENTKKSFIVVFGHDTFTSQVESKRTNKAKGSKEATCRTKFLKGGLYPPHYAVFQKISVGKKKKNHNWPSSKRANNISL